MYIYYAVRIGRSPGIFITYEEMKKQVDNFEGASYKRCFSIEEAKAFLLSKKKKKGKMANILIDENSKNPFNLKDKEFHAYVDGSYSEKTKTYSCCIVVYSNSEKRVFSFSEKRGKFMKYKSVIGELESALFAMNYVLSKKGKYLTIFYDYLGIEDFTRSNSNKELIIYYRKEYLNAINKGLKIDFVKTDKLDKFHKESHDASRGNVWESELSSQKNTTYNS